MVHPSDTAPMLIALGASVVVKGPKGATRRIAIENLHVSPSRDPRRETVLDPGEVITEIVIPRALPQHYSSYRKIRARCSWDFALAGIALVLQLDGSRILKARVALSGAAPVPWRSKEVEEVITGRTLDRATVAKGASVVMHQASPLSQNVYKVSLFEAAMEEEPGRASGRNL
jgi:xanthine dehydrogenase YagS FAD-binding subunit